VADKAKRGSSGGTARKEKLSPERRSEIAKGAAKRRWETKRKAQLEEATNVAVAVIQKIEKELTNEQQEKHCPACMNGESLEEGEGTHILATVEHPVVLPAVFQDAEASVALPENPATPQKPHKPTPAEKGKKRASKDKPVSKVYGQALAIAEKEYAETAEELAYHDEMAARLTAKLPRLLQTIRALGGTIDPQNQQLPNTAYNPPYTPPQLPQPYPEYQQPAPVMPVVSPVHTMKSGGAGVAMGVPDAWMEG